MLQPISIDGAVPFAVPIIEIAGENRVLIEHHLGVTQYGTEQICVKVQYGFITIKGYQLELMHMTKQRVVIHGQIECVFLQREKR